MDRFNKKIRLGLVFLVMWMDVIGMSLFFPVTPYIVRQYSPDALMVTLVSVFYAAAQFIAAPILGKLSDRWGRRPVLLVSLLGSAAGYALFGLSASLWMLFLSRVVNGLAGGNMSTASAYIADISLPEERAKNFTLIGLAWGVGLIAGPALGTALAQWSLMAPAFFAAGFMLLSAALGFFLLPESLPREARTAGKLRFSELNPLKSIWNMLRKPALGRLLVVLALFNLGFNGIGSIQSLYLIDKFAAKSWLVGGILVANGVGVVLLQMVIPRVVRRFGEKRTVALTLVEQVAGAVAVYSSGSLAVFLPVSVLNSWLCNFIFAPMTAMQANRVRQEEVGMLMGVTTSINSLASIFSPLWAGFLYDAVSPGSPYLVASVIYLAGALLLLEGSAATILCRGKALLARLFY